MWLLAARCTTVRSINVTLTHTSFGYSRVFLKEVLGLTAITSNSPVSINIYKYINTAETGNHHLFHIQDIPV